MAVRGSVSKETVTKVILAVFKDSFVNDKEIRIPTYCDGEEIQIKVSLTAAKTNVDKGGDAKEAISAVDVKDIVKLNPLTDEEKAELINILKDICDVELPTTERMSI